MLKYPNLKFRLNKPLDKKMAFEFLNYRKGGLDFGSSIIRFHPGLSLARRIKNVDEKKKLINQYTEQFYFKNAGKLLEAKRELESIWQKNAGIFYKKIDKIFNKFQWPKSKYICYISIFPCGPRFLKDKTFQSFYKLSNQSLEQIQHEMLHFIFYAYLEKKFPEQFQENNQEKIWMLSEFFNVIILKQNPYPSHKKILPFYKKIWSSSKNIDGFLEESFASLTKG